MILIRVCGEEVKKGIIEDRIKEEKLNKKKKKGFCCGLEGAKEDWRKERKVNRMEGKKEECKTGEKKGSKEEWKTEWKEVKKCGMKK